MAVIKEETLIAPSVDTRLSTDFNSTEIEAGIYYLDDTYTIDGQTCDKWTVICSSTEDMSSLHCNCQIWIPFTSGSTNLTTANQNIYVRTAAAGATTYGSFTTFINKDYFTENAAVNKTSYPMEIYAQTTQPSAQAGKTIVWIDTN